MHDKKIVTFNVCGVRNLFDFKPWRQWKTLSKAFTEMGADIVCFQETKLQAQDLTSQWAVVEGYQSFFTFSTSKKGYSGVAIYIKDDISVMAAEEGLSGYLKDLSKSRASYRDSNLIGGYPDVNESLGVSIDCEGRALVIDIGACVLIGLYCPANSQGNKEEYRTTFFDILDQRVRNLREMAREVVIFGDINVAPKLKDSAHALQDRSKVANTEEFDRAFYASPQKMIVNAWVENMEFQDTTRDKHPHRDGMYTCWDLRTDGRGANFGGRIDLILASAGLQCLESDILSDYYGSDHIPVYATLVLDTKLPDSGYVVPILSTKRTQAFATLQSFWVKKTKPSPSVSPSPPGNTDISQTNKVKKRPRDGTLKAFIQKSKISNVEESLFVGPEIETNTSPAMACDEGFLTDSAKAWKNIFTVKKPLCNHGEECKLMKTMKPGPNKGRSFWSCKRPQGAKGDPELRCNFFKWA